jgi:(2Fe-2S) ferredoxin
MSQANLIPARTFNLEGTFLGFLGGDSRKPKSVVLNVEHEQMAIKLPKELRAYARSSLKVGDRLCCIGKSQVDFKAGIIKLEAYQVFFLPAVENSSAATDAKATALKAGEETSLQPPSRVAPGAVLSDQQRSQILVCRKSGCQTRGGREMVAALEHILQVHQLQDHIEIRYTGCRKRCSKAPAVTIMPGNHRYEKVSPQDLPALVEEHFCLSNLPPDP